MKIIDWLLGRKKDKKLYPRGHFGVIKINGVAKSHGINDEQNKTIFHYLEGEEFRRYPYSKEMKKALEKTYSMPIIEEGEDDEFEFDTVAEFGSVKEVRR